MGALKNNNLLKANRRRRVKFKKMASAIVREYQKYDPKVYSKSYINTMVLAAVRKEFKLKKTYNQMIYRALKIES
jgi:hypothetical protein